MIHVLFYILYLIFFRLIFTCYVFSINCDNIYCHYSIISNRVLGACWGTEELGWNERSRKKLRDVRQQSNGFENYEL